MNQTYPADPLLHNYLAPSYPVFIQIKFLITGLNAKKAVKNAKSDITHVSPLLSSLLQNWDQKGNASSSHPSWKSSMSANSRTNLR